MELIDSDYPPGFASWLRPLFEARKRFLAGFSPERKAVCLAILEAFTELGRGPTLRELVDRSGLSADLTRSVVEGLDAKDALKYDAESERILAFYPFSDVPCCHRVQVGSGAPLYGM